MSNFLNTDLCQYKDIFGKPNEGSHSYRIFDIAIVDVLATIIVALLIYMLFGTRMGVPFWQILVALFAIGILAHRIFCVRTTIDRLLFSEYD